MGRTRERVVDRLPRRLWHPSNLHLGGRLHFCVGAGRDGAAEHVRTVERNDRVIARGYEPFPDEWWDAEMARLEAEDDL